MKPQPGHDLPAEDQGQVDIYYQESTASEAMGGHFHYRHELIFVTEGSADFLINGQPETADRNCLVIIGHLERHEIRSTRTPYHRYVLSVANELCLQMIREPLLLSVLLHRPGTSHVIRLGDESARRVAQIFRELLEERERQLAFWCTRSVLLLMDILLQIYRQNPDILPRNQDESAIQTVIRVQRHIAHNLSERITLEELAERHFISKYHLSRIFKEVTGYGFKDYLILYRLNEAKKLLRETRRPVTEICYATGYGNVNHFIRIFRAHEGTSPLQYRKRWAGSGSHAEDVHGAMDEAMPESEPDLPDSDLTEADMDE